MRWREELTWMEGEPAWLRGRLLLYATTALGLGLGSEVDIPIDVYTYTTPHHA